jgi:queuine/archaeosine tRNA-ribosyltransferase
LAIAELVASEGKARVVKITEREKTLSTPSYFPAISGTKASHPLEYLLDFVLSSKYPRVLVSAYDFAKMKASDRQRFLAGMRGYRSRGGFVMLDSGIFESYWKRDTTWTFQQYALMMKKIDSDFYSSFDELPATKDTKTRLAERTRKLVTRSASLGLSSHCVPVIHGSDSAELISNAGSIVKSRPDQSKIIAVPDRDCGNTLTERARTILRLQETIRRKDSTRVLHILGCGNPVSMALYAYCGADTFDSLEWSSLTIERNELRIGDFSQLELLNCTCSACKASVKDPIRKTLLHNLLFYQDFGLKLQQMIKKQTLKDFVQLFVGKEIIRGLTPS